ncbi:MAG: hypothetical protein CSB55_00470 [Candidatus Cloacimonadota bacterium]|nr:MAG: hypothetical protein CSB55_00470 [Candidatus Cloacimonadota bacterium]
MNSKFLKKIFLAATAICFFSIFADPLDFSSPEVMSQTEYLFGDYSIKNSEIYAEMPDSFNYGLNAVFSNLENIKKTPARFFRKNDRHNFIEYSEVFKKNELNFYFSVIGGVDYIVGKSDSYYNIYRGVRLAGDLNKNLIFTANWQAGHLKGDLDYAEKTSPLIKGFFKNEPDKTEINIDNAVGQITFLSNYGNFAVGRGTHQITNSITSSIVTNLDVPNYGYFSWKYETSRFDISLMNASLIPDSLSREISGTGQKIYDNKYMVIHKIGYSFTEEFYTFFGEEIFYGNRSLDPSYLLPHTFLRIIEHNQMDRDNCIIFMGANWKRKEKIAYITVLFDEMKKSEILSNWWGNKYAIQTGYGFSPFALSGEKSRLVLEFTAVRPWTYTHKYMINKISHNKFPMGFAYGSNLICFAGEFNLPIGKNVDFDINASFTRQGSLGNNFLINYKNAPETADWLEGDIINTKRLKAVINWKFNNHNSFKTGYRIEKNDEDKDINEFSIGWFGKF